MVCAVEIAVVFAIFFGVASGQGPPPDQGGGGGGGVQADASKLKI